MGDEKRKGQTDDLRNSDFSKTWAVSPDESMSQKLSEILRAAMADRTKTEQRSVLFYLSKQAKPIIIVDEPIIRIGRSSNNSTPPTIDLNDYNGAILGVSRNHAEIVYNDGQYFIKDTGSRNGTYLNGEKIPHYRQIPLKDADQLRLGHLSLIVRFSPES